MVLLKGLNYDISNQEKTFLAADVASAAAVMTVDNSNGFIAADYIVMNPFNEVTEILKITSVTNTTITPTTAVKFNYSNKDRIYKTPYNQMRFYYCATATGTYVLIDTVDILFDELHTEHEYTAGTSALYYKRTFYNETTDVETDIDSSEYFQVTDDDTYITAEQLMIYLQFANGVIELSDLKEIIKLAEMRISLDISSSNSVILKISSFLLSKYYTLNALAAKAVSYGYITATVEGRTVTKSHTELKKDAASALEEYNNFLTANIRTETSKTGFMEQISSDTRQDIIDLMTGSQDALDFENIYLNSYGVRGRRR